MFACVSACMLSVEQVMKALKDCYVRTWTSWGKCGHNVHVVLRVGCTCMRICRCTLVCVSSL